MVGYFIDAKELVRHKIREKLGTAAFVLLSSRRECFIDDFVGPTWNCSRHQNWQVSVL